MRGKDTEPRYVISIAAKMVGLHSHTLRYYERIGIIEPSRSGGNIRLYSERDIAILQRVKTLIDEMGVNLAGVEVIMRLLRRLSEQQSMIEKLESDLQRPKEVKEG